MYANTGTRVSRRAKEILRVEIKRNDISVSGFPLFPPFSCPLAAPGAFRETLKLRQLDVVLDF